MRNLYCIFDSLAVALGPIVSMAADAAAIRMFGDVASDPQTNVGRHVGDHELLCLGSVDEAGVIVPGLRVVITGAQWRASQAPSEPQLQLEA